MARKKKVELDEVDDEVLLPEPGAELANKREEERQVAIDEWLSDFQGRFSEQPVKVLVEKYEEGDWTICRKYPLAGFDQEAVRDEFGGGRYRATLYDPNGKYIKEGRHNFKFANPIRKLDEVKVSNPMENPAVTMVMESMKANQSMLTDLMKSVLTAPKPAESKNDLLTIVEVMKGVGAITPKDTGMKSFQETLGLIATAKDLFSDGKESKESGGGWLSDIKEFLTAWPEIKKSLPVPQIPTVAGAPSLQTHTEVATVKKDPLTVKLYEVIPQFIKAAEANAPIEEWGTYLGDVLEKEIMPVLVPFMKEKYRLAPIEITEDVIYDGLLKRAKDPAEREEIFRQVPPFQKYREWVNGVIDEAVRQFEFEDDPPAEDAAPAPLVVESQP